MRTCTSTVAILVSDVVQLFIVNKAYSYILETFFTIIHLVNYISLQPDFQGRNYRTICLVSLAKFLSCVQDQFYILG